jgi:hypothetical protein
MKNIDLTINNLMFYVNKYNRLPHIKEDKKLYSRKKLLVKEIREGKISEDDMLKLHDLLPYLEVNNNLNARRPKPYTSKITGKTYPDFFSCAIDELELFIQDNDRLPVPDDKYHYYIFDRLRRQHRKGLLNKSEEQKLNDLLGNRLESANKSHFIKKVSEIKQFVIENNRVPKRSEDGNLYRNLYRYKQDFKSGTIQLWKLNYLNKEFPNWIYYKDNKDVDKLIEYAKNKPNVKLWGREQISTLKAIWKSINNEGLYSVTPEQEQQFNILLPDVFDLLESITIFGGV